MDVKEVAVIAVVLLAGCTFFESLEREGFSEADLTVPVPAEPTVNYKPVAKAELPYPFSYNASWKIGAFWEHYRGALHLSIHNVGVNDLFVYGLAIQIGDERQDAMLANGQKLKPGEAETFILSFTCPSAGTHTYRLGTYLLAGRGGRWYDHELEYLDGTYEMDVQQVRDGAYELVKNNYRHYDRINDLVDPYDPVVQQQTQEVIRTLGMEYTIHRVCAIFDWIRENIEYVNDTGNEWTAPYKVFDRGGDCEEFAMLLSAMVTAAGGTARIYLSDTHAFATVYLGATLGPLGEIDDYYDANLSYAYFEDAFGYWLVADPLAGFYLGDLPVGGIATGGSGRAYRWSVLTNTLHAIDVMRS
jgi:hypothetical protein